MFGSAKIKKENQFRKYIYDLVLLAVFVCIGLVFLVIRQPDSSNKIVIVECNYCEEPQCISLNLNFDGYYFLGFYTEDDKPQFYVSDRYNQLVEIKHKNQNKSFNKTKDFVEYNILKISSNKAEMVEATCPDLICVHTKPAFRNGDTICCLPHHLTITIQDDEILTDNDDIEVIDGVTW